MNFDEKISKLRRLLKKYGAMQIILTSKDPNFQWLFQSKISGAVLIITQKTNLLITKSLEEIKKDIEHKHVGIITITKNAQMQLICKEKIKGTTLANYEEITLKDKYILNIKQTKNISEDLKLLRTIKTDDEIKKIKTACNHTTNCWDKLLQKITKKELKKEIQISNFIKTYALENNLELAFDPVVASGSNAGEPHHEPEDTLKKGFCVMDFGFSYKGYKSDMTRTIYLGKPTKQEEQTYEELLKIQQELITLAKPGMMAKTLYEKTLDLMGDNKDLFTHGLGHGVGLEIHELPNLKDESQDTLQKNQILTIEPGYYTKKYGIRIEDTIIIDDKPVILTKKASKKLITIK